MGNQPATVETKHFWKFLPLYAAIPLGIAVWFASPIVTGEVEPWDSQSSYYFIALFGAGFITTFIGKYGIVLGPLGVCIGQVAYMWTLANKGNPIFPAPFAVAFFGTYQTVAGSLMGWLVSVPFRLALAGSEVAAASNPKSVA